MGHCTGVEVLPHRPTGALITNGSGNRWLQPAHLTVLWVYCKFDLKDFISSFLNLKFGSFKVYQGLFFSSYGTAKGKFSRCVSTWEFCTALFYIFGLLISHPDAISQQKPLLLWFCTECLSLARRSKQMGKLHQECLYECRNTSSVINSASELKLAQV